MMGEPYIYNRINMSPLKNSTVDGKLMTDNAAKLAIDRNEKKGRKMLRILEGSWVSFDERTLTTETVGQETVTTDGHTTLKIKDGRLKLTIKGKEATFTDEQAMTPEQETAIDEWTKKLMEERLTVTGQATMTGQVTTTGQTATTGQGMTSNEEAELPDENRLFLWNLEKVLLQTGRDETTTVGRMTLPSDGRITAVQTMEATAEQAIEMENQTLITGMDEQLMDEQMITIAVEEPVVEVDPLAFSPTEVIGDDPVVGHFSVEDAPIAPPIVEQEVQQAAVVGSDGDSDVERIGGIDRRVVGRKQVVVVDDESDTMMSIVSITSADEGSSLASSSLRITRSKGIKRRLESVKEKRKVEEKGSSEERKGKKRKEKKKDGGRKDTPVEKEEVGKHGEPKGLVDHVLKDMSSEVLGGAIQDWADSIEDIRSRSKNIQGKLSGMMKKSVAKIKEGTALLVARSTASGDPEFLRMRNTELTAELREAKREIARLEERLKKSPELPSPPRKKKKERVMRDDAVDAVVSTDPVDFVDPPSPREAFPPLPQRTPRAGAAQDGGVKKKVGPRIVSDIQVAPPFKDCCRERVAIPALPGLETEWRVAAGSRRRGRVKGDKPPPPPPSLPNSGEDRKEGRPPPLVRQQQQPRVRLPRPPTSSAVTITGRVDDFSYADAMKRARKQINLEALGIKVTRVRKTLNGGFLIEVPGEDSRAKAEELVTRLRDVLKDSAAVSCPTKKCELRVTGFDESVSADEIVEVLSNSGGCSLEDVKLGPIRTMTNGLGTVWAQLPVAAAAKVVEEARIRLGWTMARVELLKTRPLQCYRCWSYGHVQNVCHSVTDRRGACFKCGQVGHVASACQNAVHCAVCHDAGLEATHRMGGIQCMAQVQRSTSSRPTATM